MDEHLLSKILVDWMKEAFPEHAKDFYYYAHIGVDTVEILNGWVILEVLRDHGLVSITTSKVRPIDMPPADPEFFTKLKPFVAARLDQIKEYRAGGAEDERRGKA